MEIPFLVRTSFRPRNNVVNLEGADVALTAAVSTLIPFSPNHSDANLETDSAASSLSHRVT